MLQEMSDRDLLPPGISGLGQFEYVPYLGVKGELVRSTNCKTATAVIGLDRLAMRKRAVGSTVCCRCRSPHPKPRAYTKRRSFVTASTAPGTCCSCTNVVINSSKLANSGCAMPEVAGSFGLGGCACSGV